MAILLLVSLASHCLAYEFTVEGEIRMRDYFKGEPDGATNYYFIAELRDCNSRIRVFGGTYASMEFFEYGWDTKSSYVLEKFRTNWVSTVIWRNGKFTPTSDHSLKPLNDAVLYLFPSEVPRNGYGMEPIWLAYASRCHYNAQQAGTKVEPVWFIDGLKMGKESGKFKSYWSMSENFPGLLGNMSDFANDLPPFDADATNSIYSVTSWTNVAGLTVPRIFQIIHYRPSSSVFLHRVYEGVANSIRPVCSATNFFPQLPNSMAVRVYDERLSREATNPVSKITYLSSTGKVVQDLDELRGMKAYASAQRKTKETAALEARTNTAAGSRPVIFATFFAGLIFPVWILVRGFRQNQEQKEKMP